MWAAPYPLPCERLRLDNTRMQFLLNYKILCLASFCFCPKQKVEVTKYFA